MGWSHTGYGIIQWSWTSSDHERKPGLWDFAANMGSNVTDIYVQTMYLIKEMTDGSQSFAYNDSYFRSLTDPAVAAKYFCDTFERAGDAHVNNRTSYAQYVYSKLQSSS